MLGQASKILIQPLNRIPLKAVVRIYFLEFMIVDDVIKRVLLQSWPEQRRQPNDQAIVKSRRKPLFKLQAVQTVGVISGSNLRVFIKRKFRVAITSTVETRTNLSASTVARTSISFLMAAQSAAGSRFAFHLTAETPAHTTVRKCCPRISRKFTELRGTRIVRANKLEPTNPEYPMSAFLVIAFVLAIEFQFAVASASIPALSSPDRFVRTSRLVRADFGVVKLTGNVCCSLWRSEVKVTARIDDIQPIGSFRQPAAPLTNNEATPPKCGAAGVKSE